MYYEHIPLLRMHMAMEDRNDTIPILTENNYAHSFRDIYRGRIRRSGKNVQYIHLQHIL